MKKNDIIVDSLIFAVIMLFSCVVTMFAEILAMTVLNKIVIMNAFTVAMIRAVIYSAGCFAIISIVSYKIGYHDLHLSTGGTVVSGILASILHFIFSLLFSFEAFCAGAVKFVASLMKFGGKMNSPKFDGELFRYDCILAFCIYAALYISLIAIFTNIGAHRRAVDRKELFSAPSQKSNSEGEEE